MHHLQQILRWLCLLAMANSIAIAPLIAQDTLQLAHVEIVEIRFAKESAGDLVQSFDLHNFSSGAANSPTDWLLRSSNLALRGYGSSSSIGLSIRGSSPAQSQVLINGLSIDNPSLAQADLSLLPPDLFSSFQLLRGGSGTFLGNSAIGGSLLLKANTDTTSLGFIRVSAGSFGLFNLSTVANYRLGKTRHSTHIYNKQSDNDFERTNPLNRNETEPQPHAAIRTKGIAHVAEQRLGKKTSLSFLGWYGETDRQLPPNISKPASTERQEDRTLRLQAGVRSTLRGLEIESDLAFTHGALNYFNSQVGIADYADFTTLQGRIKLAKRAKWGDLFTTVNLQNSRAETSAYDRTHERLSPSIVSGIRQDLISKRLEYAVSLRQEWLNDASLPLIPQLGLAFKVNSWMSLRGNLGRAYRLPGLNDLYWNPGGNPDLLPESGWFQELGFSLSEKQQQPRYELSITAFNRRIDNWITWIPGGAFWSPVNFKEVHTRGVEALGWWSLRQKKRFSVEQSVEATYTRAENVSADSDVDPIGGKQLVYTPEWSLFYAQRWSFWNGKLSPEMRLRYQSKRYTLADNTRWLEPFLTADFTIGSDLQFGRTPIALYATVLNVLNQSYQLQASHPMPGRAFEVGIQLSLVSVHKACYLPSTRSKNSH